MATLPGSTDQEKLAALAERTYKEQAVWFLNAFFDSLESEAERVWEYKHKCDEYDLQKHEEGNALDELNAHRLLEAFNETMTVREMRDSLRETGAIKKDGRLKVVPLVHWLVFRYKVDFHRLVNASQGDNSKEIAEAQRLLDEVQSAFEEAAATAKAAADSEREAKAAEVSAKEREAEAKASEQEAVAREADAKAAQVELEAALAEVKAQEDAYNAKTELLKKKSEEGGVVSRNKAKNELAQHLGEDPLPLRRAKITQEAAVKKAERATKAASDARAQAEQDAVKATESRAAAEASARQAEQDRVAAEAAVQDAQAKVAEAEAYLEEVKSKASSGGAGALWWMSRELEEKKKYLPTSRGGTARS